MTEPYVRSLSQLSVDEDFEADYREATKAAREREHDEVVDMIKEDQAMAVLDEVALNIGVGCAGDLLRLVDHVKFVVFDVEYAQRLREFVPMGSVIEAPKGSLGEFNPSPDELLVTTRAGMVHEPPQGNCFWLLCKKIGVSVDLDVVSPSMLSGSELESLLKRGSQLMVFVQRDVCSLSHYRNHVQLVEGMAAHGWVKIGCKGHPGELLYQSCMTLGEFLKSGVVTYVTNYFSGNEYDGGFGELTGGPAHPGYEAGSAGGSVPLGNDRGRAGAPASVRAESVRPGSTNLSGGVVRRTRRVIPPKSSYGYGPLITRSYAVSNSVMFNNMDELVLDAISPDMAQEVLETVFTTWGIGAGAPDEMKYAEDLVFTFLIASTASDKADYNREYDLPVRSASGAVVADFKVLSDLLIMKFGITRRQLTRGLADRLRQFARHEDNGELRAGMAARAGCQLQYADLAFDGSTHCKGMGPTEIQFTRTLESRNLFEQDGVLAVDASNKLLTGFSQRVRQ